MADKKNETIWLLVAGRISDCQIDCNKMNEHTNQAESELDHDDTQEIMNNAWLHKWLVQQHLFNSTDPQPRP